MIDRARFDIYAYTTLRVLVGLLFACHGLPKLFGILFTRPDQSAAELWSQGWFGGVIELVAGVFIALGLFTRPAAFLASGTMAVAYIQFHWKGALDERFLPMVNDGELAVVYCFLFLFMWIRGAGPISIDRQLGRSVAP